jgi:mRNA-degrading endonuclease RelE of RelBE toxin-antitoxin system
VGPPYRVDFRAEVVLNGETACLSREQWRRVLERLEQHPEQGKRLTGPLKGWMRHRVDDVRIVYGIEEAGSVVVIHAVGMRRDDAIYKLAQKRR